jgi:uncharacterized membrane protein YeaQ/YmgE (transglycosylase-associated protein family)
MGIISFIILGLIAGAIAKAIHPGDNEPGGLFGTLAVGVAGALAGGLVASAAGLGGLGSFFSLGTWLIAIAGALALVGIYSAVTSGHGPRDHRSAQS